MNNKILASLFLLVLSGSLSSQAQQPWQINTIFPEQQSYSKDKLKKLNIIIPDFQVNENAGPNGADQESPAISSDSSGNFVMVWVDDRNGDADIYAQRYASDGSVLGTNFKVNEDQGSGFQYSPSISTDGSGNFVITWQDYPDIYAQRYSNDGNTLGPNFKVNDNIEDARQSSPSISTDSSGNFVITWEDYRDVYPDIYMQRYSIDGSAVENNFRVTNTGKKNQYSPDINLCNNRIYSTWQDSRAGGTGYDIWANVLSGHDSDQISFDFILYQNYPNPLYDRGNSSLANNLTTCIGFSLSNPGLVTLKIYDILGREIATLVNENRIPGHYIEIFHAKNLPSGIYFYRLTAGEFMDTKKIILQR